MEKVNRIFTFVILVSRHINILFCGELNNLVFFNYANVLSDNPGVTKNIIQLLKVSRNSSAKC